MSPSPMECLDNHQPFLPVKLERSFRNRNATSNVFCTSSLTVVATKDSKGPSNQSILDVRKSDNVVHNFKCGANKRVASSKTGKGVSPKPRVTVVEKEKPNSQKKSNQVKPSRQSISKTSANNR